MTTAVSKLLEVASIVRESLLNLIIRAEAVLATAVLSTVIPSERSASRALTITAVASVEVAGLVEILHLWIELREAVRILRLCERMIEV